MPSDRYVGQVREQFRFYDDLHPRLRQFIREASYQWSPASLMVDQHRCQGNELTIEDIYQHYQHEDENRFHRKMSDKLYPKDERG